MRLSMSDDRSPHEPGDKTWLEKIANAFSPEPKTRNDVVDVLKVAKDNDIIDAEALSIIEGAMEVSDLQVHEVMIPRSQMVVIKASSSPQEFLPTVIQSGHSRFPVVGDTIDDVKGILLAKDLLTLVLDREQFDNFDISRLLRTSNFVPESKRLNVLLKDFREKRYHMAVVIDEYGGVSGLITIEDVLEEIVGEIEDETDEDDTFIKQIGANDYIIKALTPIEEFNEHFTCKLPDDEFDTIGGLVMQSFGHVPLRGESTALEKYQFKVLNADNRRIHLLRMNMAGLEN